MHGDDSDHVLELQEEDKAAVDKENMAFEREGEE